ncbi:diphthamide biosynthesis protein 2 [Solanum tuberosum]|uniref:2-(3-amino-3-carboxypropyl)histidine synthase subunit 2 n=1 Tax=Solanum tuberosum TaxID=4113 RepID=M1CQG5_SOLTU|nr:PREDICTED: diphthamide biosynthesis protein 2 [Solanum tuberosum]
MDLESTNEIDRVAGFISARAFRRVALQFPDKLLKDSTRIVAALHEKLRSFKQLHAGSNGDAKDVKLYVMADTMYGNCCVDEVGASHANADCVIHYGHTCFSPTSTLPAFLVLGKASLNVPLCAQTLCEYTIKAGKPILVLYGLEYTHAITEIKASVGAQVCSELEVHYADIMSPIITPPETFNSMNEQPEQSDGQCANGCSIEENDAAYCVGGLTWSLPVGRRIEDYLIFYVGSDDPAFANILMTYNACEIVRYDATEDNLVNDFSQQKRILKRRYFLIEKAKDASIIGILVGTLGVAGYLHMIHQMKDLITRAGKKAYTFVMGRPNPAKLANFPECDIFVYVSCAQTALLDSKEFLAPVITPFEAMIAFGRGSEWTGAYVTEFRDLITSSPMEAKNQSEARFSFIQGGYVEDVEQQEVEEVEDGVSALVNITEKALRVRDKDSQTLMPGTAKSGAEYFATRSYHGLDIHPENNFSEPFLIGKSGRASGYKNETAQQS